jgi:hypothetical protein
METVTVGIDEMLFLNQLAQGLRSDQDARSWFQDRSKEDRKEILRFAVDMARQAGARDEDVHGAVLQSNLKATFTPCVMLSRSPLKTQYHRILELPSGEWEKALLLIIALFSVANARRVAEHPENYRRHWWNWDLSDEDTISKIRTLYREGAL